MSLVDIKETLRQSVISLIKDHDIKQSTVFNWIRDAMQEYSMHIPKTRVLYNKCFGGYGFCNDFKMFRAKRMLTEVFLVETLMRTS